MRALITIILTILVLVQSQYTPSQIHSMMGKGFDVAWSQYAPIQKKYTSALPKMIS